MQNEYANTYTTLECGCLTCYEDKDKQLDVQTTFIVVNHIVKEDTPILHHHQKNYWIQMVIAATMLIIGYIFRKE